MKLSEVTTRGMAGKARKNIKKDEAFSHLSQLIELLPDEFASNHAIALTELIHIYEPKNKKKAKTDRYAWLAQAVSTDVGRYVLTHVHADAENVVATCGKRLHLMPNTDSLKGFIDPNNKTNVTDVKDVGTYPNYKQALPDYKGGDYKQITLITENLKIDACSSGKKATKIESKFYDLKHIKEACSMGNPDVTYICSTTHTISPLVMLWRDGRLALVMPLI